MTNAMIAYENVTKVTASTKSLADGGWYAVITNVTKTADDYFLPVSGSAHLILCDGATLAITNRSTAAAISVGGGAALTIYGQTEDSGRLAVMCRNSGAGIGGGNGGTYEAVANTDETTKVEYPWAVADNRQVIMPGVVLGPYDTAALATNVMAGSIFMPSAKVIEKLGAGSSALRAYSEKFRIGVVPQSDGTWTVEALLKPEPWTNVVESAQEMTRQIPLEEIRELQLGMPVTLTYWLGVPGFYYSFYSGNVVTNVRAIVSEDGRNVLCGTDEEVTFSGVTKPSDEAGFFTIGAKESPGVTPSDRAELEPPARMGFSE